MSAQKRRTHSRLRARQMALDYLNRLGAEGWQIIVGPGAAYLNLLPMGSYLLMRRRVDE